jgi:hypothetical protein
MLGFRGVRVRAFEVLEFLLQGVVFFFNGVVDAVV